MELRSFEGRWAREIAQWISDDASLRLIAPGTVPPLTPEKIEQWGKPDGWTATGWPGSQEGPVAYGEVNPIRRRAGCFWLGHVIVDPERRRRGHGLSFVHALLAHAFDVLQARLVALIVFPENHPAIECYIRAGLRITGEERHRFRPNGVEEKLLRLEITRARFHGKGR